MSSLTKEDLEAHVLTAHAKDQYTTLNGKVRLILRLMPRVGLAAGGWRKPLPSGGAVVGDERTCDTVCIHAFFLLTMLCLGCATTHAGRGRCTEWWQTLTAAGTTLRTGKDFKVPREVRPRAILCDCVYIGVCLGGSFTGAWTCPASTTTLTRL
jgi:hypothetical protein